MSITFQHEMFEHVGIDATLGVKALGRIPLDFMDDQQMMQGMQVGDCSRKRKPSPCTPLSCTPLIVHTRTHSYIRTRPTLIHLLLLHPFSPAPLHPILAPAHPCTPLPPLLLPWYPPPPLHPPLLFNLTTDVPPGLPGLAAESPRGGYVRGTVFYVLLSS
jgi:hypothetical protein